MTRNGTVYTFYSHKGGAGRTMLLANVAWLLSEWGYRVLCVDFDLEAPGLLRYFDNGADSTLADDGHGIVDWALAVQRAEPGQPVEPPVIVALSVGKRLINYVGPGADPDYYSKLDQLDWNKLDDNGFGEHVERARADWVRDFDFVLVDARAGSTALGAVATSLLADDVVLVSPPTAQSIVGCATAAQRIRAARDLAGFRSGPVRFLAVPSRADALAERDLAREWLEKHVTAFRVLHQEWTDADPVQVVAHLRIPHISYWSFGERLPVGEEDGRDPLTMSWAYHNIAATLAHQLDGVEQLLDRRNTYLRTARPNARGVAPSTPAWRESVAALVLSGGGWGAFARWRSERRLVPRDEPGPGAAGDVLSLDHFEWLRELPGADARLVSELQAAWEGADRAAPPEGGEPAITLYPTPTRPRPLPVDLGLCLVVDIADYASAGRSTQQAMMRFLLGQVMGLPVLAHARRGKEFHVQSAGDGFLLVLDPKLSSNAARELAAGAFRLLSACASFEQRFHKPLGVRVALNRVSWSPGLGGLQDLNLMEGSGFGTAQLVAALARPGQIVATEEYVQELVAVERLDGEDALTIAPPLGAEPWVVPLRNRKEVRFRLLRAGDGEPGPDADEAAVPPVVALQREARDRLRSELFSQLMAVSGTLSVSGAERRGTPPLWRARLWCPDTASGDRLVASTFGLDQNYASLPTSRMQWALRPRAIGPLARAFVKDKPDWLIGLPSPNSSAYFTRWRRLGISADEVAAFTRAPRSILAVPFGLLPGPSASGGVICLDCDSPLDDVAVADIRGVLDELYEMSSPYVAALWSVITG